MSTSKLRPTQLRSTPAKYTTLIGNGVDAIFTLSPGFSTQSCVVQIFEESTGTMVGVEDVTLRVNSDTQVTIKFSVIPSADQFRVVIIG